MAESCSRQPLPLGQAGTFLSQVSSLAADKDERLSVGSVHSPLHTAWHSKSIFFPLDKLKQQVPGHIYHVGRDGSSSLAKLTLM